MNKPIFCPKCKISIEDMSNVDKRGTKLRYWCKCGLEVTDLKRKQLIKSMKGMFKNE